MARETRFVYDGSLSFERGVDAGRPPSTLSDVQVSYAFNGTCRGGYWRNRPLIHTLDYGRVDADIEWWADNKYQGASGYTDLDGKGYVFFSVGGRLYRFPLDEYLPTIQEVSTLSTRNNPNNDQVWFCQAEHYLIAQDGRSAPWLWDGNFLSRIPAGNNFPIGTAMAYGIGRIWVAQGSAYYGGDLVGSDASLPAAASILRFTENDYLAEGGSFRVPADAGPITGLSFTAKQDTVSGQGSLMVFTRNSIFEFDAPVDRTTWADLRQPLQRFSLLNFGATSQQSIVKVNGDLFFRAQDGIRSFYFARRDFGSWGNTPISRELGKSVSQDPDIWLRYCKATLFDNRLLMTIKPSMTSKGPVWSRLVSLDFDLIAGMAEKLPPAWEGEWETTGEILDIITVKCRTGIRCIVVLQDPTDGVGFYELMKDGKAAEEDVTWGIDTKAYQFGFPLDNKKLQTFESWWDEQSKGGNIDVWWKPNSTGCWAPWGRYVAAAGGCVLTPESDNCVPPVFSGTQAKNRVGLPLAPDLQDETNCKPRREGFSHQIRIRTNARATLKMLRLASQVIESPTMPEFDNSCTELTSSCETCQ